MRNKLFTKIKRNVNTGLWFILVFAFSSYLIFDLYFSPEPQAYLFLFLFHFVQFVLTCYVFSPQFENYGRNFKSLLFMLIFGLIYFIQYFYYHLIKFAHYSDQSVIDHSCLYSLCTLMPAMFLFLTEFLIGEVVIDLVSYQYQLNILNSLKQKGSISDELYVSKLNELNVLKVKTEISLSEEYNKLKKEFKKGNVDQKILTEYLENETFKKLKK